MRTVAVMLAIGLAGCTQPNAPSSEPANGVANAPVQAAGGDQPENQAAVAEAKPGTPAAAASPCLVQDGEPVTHRLKALGTEPFWAAEVEGRCVTYKTPEDQAGTRIWTHVDTGPQGPAWNGALEGRQFQLTVVPSTGCSDGMSDKTYPMEAVLRVRGETRRGCAEPL